MTVPKKQILQMDGQSIHYRIQFLGEKTLAKTKFIEKKSLIEVLREKQHDFPNQFPKNIPKYEIENAFIKSLLELLD